MALQADGMKPVLMMLVVQVVQAGVTIFFKLAISSGVSVPVILAYRFLLSTAVMVLAYHGTGSVTADLTWLEKLEFGTAIGIAKVFGTIMGIGGAMLFTFYKGFPIQFLKSDINLLPGTSTAHVALLASDHRVLGACLAITSCFSYAIWIILQAKMSETFPCHYTSTGLMSLMAFFQSTIYALCVERDWSQWKLGWDITLWTVAYSGTVGTALVVTLITISSRLRGPLFVAIFNPLMLVIVSLVGVFFLDEKLYLGSVLGAILIVCGLYVVLWGKHNEMKKRINEVVPSNENEGQKSVEIIVVSGSSRSSSV
ncbi:hypothetical protein Bca52824_014023 [Brassica carinata]|uniref:WAT1-related protein n=1 Tax=Brassica carinata TaxID=52824 RepID=A0A8X7W1I0_BRACI|nr:hypothetical protein Bca52824_014023 [Brassica carinata]